MVSLRRAAILLPMLLLTACRAGTQDPAPAPSSVSVDYTSYVEPRYSYTLKQPAEWTTGGSQQGDQLFVRPKGIGFMEPNGPSIRVFVKDTDPAKGRNLQPSTKEQLIGKGNWPYLTVDSAEDMKVKTATGEVPGYFLTGKSETKGVQHQGVGLYVYGTGHSIQVYCSAPKDEWSAWKDLCQEVVRSFVAGDLAQAHLPK